VTPLAAALAEVMAAHDWTPADLAREVGMSVPTIRGYTSGRVVEPRSEHRAALDRCLAPGLPPGTTRAICAGDVRGYPSEPAVKVWHIVRQLERRAVAALAELLESLRG
jgi:transcriptional regulator with XRE-family HTH domain